MQSIIYDMINTAIKAGKRILEIYNSDFSYSTKSDNSPLTLADRESHRIIIEGLNRCYPDIPLMSEEGKDIPYDIRKDWGYYFLIDPLDGTKEFIKRNGEFTVNIALIEKNRPVAGVIFIPVHKRLYYALENHGSYKLILNNLERDALSLDEIKRNSIKLPIERNNTKGNYIVIAGSRSHSSREMDVFLESLKRKYGDIEFIPAGSSLKFCLIAEGVAHIYPRLGTTMEWDTAAGQCIVEEAKGVVVAFDTQKPLVYNKETLMNPWFIALRSKGLLRDSWKIHFSVLK